MADANGNNSSNSNAEERRGLERRITALETLSTALSTSVNEVKAEQKHQIEIVKLSFQGMDARITTVDRGNDLIVEKIDQLTKVMTESIGDSTKSPMGRELAKDITALNKIAADHSKELYDLGEEAAELRGALKFARNTNIWAIIIGLAAVVVTLVKLMSSGKVTL